MANNQFNKYSKTGGLNPLWVERDMEIREEKKQRDYVDYVCDVASKSVASALNSVNNNNANNNYNNNRNRNKGRHNVSLDNELEIKFQFLKRHSDGTETDYEMAKHVLGLK